MDTIYFFIYLLITAISIISFTFLRCRYDYTIFDPLLYPNQNYAILENYTFLLYHFSIYFILGLLFGFDVFIFMIFKIIVFEIYLFAVEYCDIFQTAKTSNLVITLMISLIAYLFGCFINKVSST
jgi:hypothetical protein